jgi:hypothetical protein
MCLLRTSIACPLSVIIACPSILDFPLLGLDLGEGQLRPRPKRRVRVKVKSLILMCSGFILSWLPITLLYPYLLPYSSHIYATSTN